MCRLIQKHTGHDFCKYKKATLLRRIRRRLQGLHVTAVADYIELLESSAAEADALVKNLLIGVTQFFRDPETFDTLARQVLPRITAADGEQSPLRIWVPGCASGEEAYTVAMLVREHLERCEQKRAVQLFATDINEAVLAQARHGRYSSSIGDAVSPERLERFFTREGEGYQASKELREMCLFSQHSLIRDPPFSQLDLISCRNVVIYLNADLQKKLIPLFHYALRPGGFLFLGPSEGVAQSTELFESIDKKSRIFRRKDTLARPMVEFPLSLRGAAQAPPALPRSQPEAGSQAGSGVGSGTRERVGAAFERAILQDYAPASAVINERGEVLFVAGPLARYLVLPAGAMSTTNLFDAFRGPLRLELRSALIKAANTRRACIRTDVPVEIEGQSRPIRLIVRPVPTVEAEAGLYLVVVEEQALASRDSEQADASSGPEEPALQQLESELRTTRAELRSTVEELESANEELKSSNEELISTNEELQSANEEMQTSKEELNSLNEELETVNEELREKLDEVASANGDLQNLFAATQIATIFLDRSLRITKFTPAATALFHLIASDVGRPLADLSPRFAGQDLVPEALEVLCLLTTVERQVQTPDGHWFVLRILPYRTIENFIAGVVVTFVNISEVRRAEEAAKKQAQLVHLSHDAIFVRRFDGVVESWNRGAQELYGFSREEAIGRISHDLLATSFPQPLAEIEAELRVGGCWAGELRQRTKDGRLVIVLANKQYARGDDGIERVLEANRDITERTFADRALRESEERLRLFIEHAPASLAMFDRQMRYLSASKRWIADYRLAERDLRGVSHYEIFPEIDDGWRQIHRRALSGEVVRAEADRFVRADGTVQWLRWEVRPWHEATGGVGGIIIFSEDITEITLVAERARESEQKYSVIYDRAPFAIALIKDSDGTLAAVNDAWEKMFGYRRHEVIGKTSIELGLAGDPDGRARMFLEMHKTGSVRDWELAYTTQSGQRRLGSFSFDRIELAGQKFRLGTAIDITERKRAEEGLRLSEEKFAKAFRGSTSAMAITGLRDGLFVDVNERWQEMTGISREKAIGQTSSQLNIWKYKEERERFIRDLEQQGMVRNGEFRFLSEGGREWTALVSSEVSTLQGETVVISSIIDITERKRAEEALLESEQRFRLALRNSPVAVAAQDADLKYIWGYNQKTARPEQIVGLRDEDIFGPEDAKHLAEIKRRVLELGVEHREQMWFDGPTGRMFLDACWEPIRDEAGRVTGVASATVDLTQIRLADEALRRFELVVQQSRDIILFMNLDNGRIMEANPAASAAYGYSRDELLSLTIHDLRASGTQAILTEQLEQANVKGVLFETTHRRKDGSAFPVEVSSRGTEVGGARTLVSVVRDITERRKAEATEREQRELAERRAAELDAILDSLTEPLVVSDPAGNLVRVNPAFRRMIGAPENWQGLDIGERIRQVKLETADGKPVDPAQTPGARALAGETVHGVLQRLPRPDGSVLHLSTSSAPIRTAAGVMGAVVVFSDMTERVRAEHELRDADRRKNEFLAVLSHELRNPLTPIRNSLHILKRAAAGGEQAKRAEAVLGRQTDQLVRLVDDLLDITRISRNKIQLKCTRVDLGDVVSRAVEDHRSLFESRGIALGVLVAPEMLTIEGDEPRLAQVVGNLLSNAAKFTPSGGQVTVATTKPAGRGRAQLRIVDTGAGIDPGMLKRLFQPFMQADETLDRSKGGLGLGLALVKSLVEMHGGEVCAHSDGLGKGAEFVVELPLLSSPMGEATPARGAREQIRRRVLIIEDNVDAAESLRDALELSQHHVEVAYSGPEGLQKARSFHPDVVLCDIGLPGMDGFEVAKSLRADAQFRETFLVALSGYALPEDLERAAKAGFHRHLAKPPSLEALDETLASLPMVLRQHVCPTDSCPR
jgi:PAS domain S-box-containing protein